MKWLVFLLPLLFIGCINVKVEMPKEVEKQYVYEEYPIYQVVEKPELENISGSEMHPWRDAATFAGSRLQGDDKKKFDEYEKKAKTDEQDGLKKIKDNYDKLIKWGKKNEATVRSYNEYATEKNKREKEEGK